MVCMRSTCNATFHEDVFNKCTLVVAGGTEATLHSAHFKNMEQSEAGLSVYAHSSGSQVHLHGGGIHGGVQGVVVHAAARLQASDLTVSDLQLAGLEVCGAESLLTVQRGTIDRFLSPDEVNDHFREAQQGVCVHTHANAQLSGVAIASMWQGCLVTNSASVTLADCTALDTRTDCVNVSDGSTAQLSSCTLSSGGEGCHSLLQTPCRNGLASSSSM